MLELCIVHMNMQNFYLENSTKTRIPSSIISDSLDYGTIDAIPPPASDRTKISAIDDCVMPRTNSMRLNETALKHALAAHNRGIYSLFASDYHLSRSSQEFGMLLFPKLSLFSVDLVCMT